MNEDDRPLYMLASRAAVILQIPVVSSSLDYPADPKLRATCLRDVRVAEKMGLPLGTVVTGEGKVCPLWLELGRPPGARLGWELVALDGSGFRRRVVYGYTPKAFRAAFSGWDDGRDAEKAIAARRLP